MNFITKKIKKMRVTQDILQILSAPSRSAEEIKTIKIEKINFDEQIANKNERNTRYASILMIVLSILSFIQMIINNSLFLKIYDLAFSMLALFLFLCSSFSNYNIRLLIKRKETGEKKFFKFITGDIKNIFKCILPLFVFVLFFSQEASANPLDNIEKWFQNPSSNDTTGQIFQLVNAQSPFFNSIAVFASFVFATAVIGWCFYIIPLMLKAAEEGSFTKNIFGSVGLVRLCLMACFLFPIPSAGSAGVLLAFETLKVSNNLANSVWNPYFDSTLTPPKDSTSTGISEVSPNFNSVDLAKNILKAELCYNVISQEDKENLSYYNINQPDLKGSKSTNSVNWSYGNCGNFSYSINEKPITIENKWNDGNINLTSAMSTYNQARINAMSSLISKIRNSEQFKNMANFTLPIGIVQKKISSYPSNISGALSAYALQYDNDMKKASVQLNNTVNQAYYNKAKSDNEEYGWLLMFYHSSILANAQSISNQMIQKTLVASNLSNNEVLFSYSAPLKAAENQLNDELKKEAMKSSMMDGADLADSANTSDSYWTQKLIAPLSHKMAETLGEMASTDQTDPLSTIRNEGQYLFDAFDVGFSGGVAGAVVLGNFASEKLGGASVLNFLSPYLFIILAGLWISAFIHAFVMPMTMTIMGTFILIAWLKTIVEFVICQPVLWFKYANMSGEKIIDRPHESGLDLLIGTLLFPTLTVLSFEAVNIVLPIVMNYINLTFVNSFIAQQGNSVSGLITDAAMILMLSSIQLASFVACMHIVRDVPSDVIKRFNGWIATAGDVQHNTGNVIANVESKSKETAGDIRHTLQNQNRSANPGKKVNPNQNNQNSEMLQQQKMPNKSVGKNESKNSEEKKTENNDDKDGTTQQSK